MMKIALLGSRFNDEDVSVLNVLLDKLQAGQSQVYFESRFFEILQEFPDIKSVNPSQTWTQLDSSFDLLITIGGDGTLLRAIKYLNGLEVPGSRHQHWSFGIFGHYTKEISRTDY